MFISTNHSPRGWRVSALLATVAFAAVITIATSTPPKLVAPAQAASKASALQVVAKPSPHYSKRASRTVDTVVVHYMSGINIAPSRWDDVDLNVKILRQYGVSAHYIIDRLGTVYKLVEEKNVAWHAGGSIMPAPDNRRNVNRFSVGIELIGTKTSGFSDAQYDSLATLVDRIKSRHPIRNIVGHDQISGQRAVSLGLRKDVKPDPGSKFDWPRLKRMLAEME